MNAIHLVGKLFDVRKQYLISIDALGIILKNWRLIFILTKRELNDPYSGQMFGRFWTLGHPLFLMLLYTFIFNIVFSARMGDTYELPLDYTVYILSGLVPWLCFQTTLSKGCAAISSNANLVKQVVFPLEVLPLKTALASMAVLFIGVAFVIIYSLLRTQTIYLTYLLLPFVMIIQLVAMFGVAYGLSAIAVFIKDTKDIVQLFSMTCLFFMPVIYLPGSIPTIFKFALYLNPFSYMGWVYQDVLYFGRIEHPTAWVIFLIISFLEFVVGYYMFSKLRPYFGNFL